MLMARTKLLLPESRGRTPCPESLPETARASQAVPVHGPDGWSTAKDASDSGRPGRLASDLGRGAPGRLLDNALPDDHQQMTAWHSPPRSPGPDGSTAGSITAGSRSRSSTWWPRP